MGDARRNLLRFFDRPREPCFMKKGEDNVSFQVPDHYYPEKYRKVRETLTDRLGDDTQIVNVKNIAIPDLSLPMQLPFYGQFSLFVEHHRKMSGHLIDVLLNMRDLEDLLSICSYCQLRINPYMFNYCLSVALLHREDTKGLNIPTFVESFPDKFMDPKVFRQAREVTTVVPSGTRMPVTIPTNLTASQAEPEQRVAYFREDMGVNLHHWHWHLVYPAEGDMTVVDKDRRGELFYYMHQQIIARYNVARMCNNLGQVNRYSDFSEPIAEGYFPKLDSPVASRAWPPRFAGSVIRDIDRPVDQIRIEVSQMDIWRDRIIQAIENMSIILPNNTRVPLDEETGIDVLGNLLESSTISRNRGYYGDLHNMGHVFISYAHDPDNRHLELFGVMGDLATTMRDPAFYRWHSHIDDLFYLYKSKLSPYTEEQLSFPGIEVSSVGTEGPAGRDILSTRWEQSGVELARGLDFMPQGSIQARFTHLQHDEFTYVIEVNNSGEAAMGTFRIFLAPVRDERGQEFSFSDQRRLMIELDKFSQPLNSGSNTIRRSSVESSVTIPFERTFASQSLRAGAPGSAAAAEFDFCGCGWPHHMLIPKGTDQGYPVVLYVMVTDWNQDRVQQDTTGTCNDAASFCGIRDRKYPDRRPMGFPFDRPVTASSLSEFLRPNMAMASCNIQFTDVILVRGQG